MNNCTICECRADEQNTIKKCQACHKLHCIKNCMLKCKDVSKILKKCRWCKKKKYPTLRTLNCKYCSVFVCRQCRAYSDFPKCPGCKSHTTHCKGCRRECLLYMKNSHECDTCKKLFHLESHSWKWCPRRKHICKYRVCSWNCYSLGPYCPFHECNHHSRECVEECMLKNPRTESCDQCKRKVYRCKTCNTCDKDLCWKCIEENKCKLCIKKEPLKPPRFPTIHIFNNGNRIIDGGFISVLHDV